MGSGSEPVNYSLAARWRVPGSTRSRSSSPWARTIKTTSRSPFPRSLKSS